MREIETTFEFWGTKIYNPNESAVTHQDAEDFIGALGRELQQGYGFVPFVGAGFSAPSGAPLVKDIRAYLRRCIHSALVKPKGSDRPWEPRRDRWPSFTGDSSSERLNDPSRWFDELLKEYRKLADDNEEKPIFQEALGAMAEWRSALLFLSRLVRYVPRSGSGSGSGRLALAPPQQEVIDECLRVAMEGRQPSLEHRMLAMAAGLLRLDVLLTTNFDTLLERAFMAVRNPLEVHDIDLGSSLPDWKAVSTNRSLIKLHGTNYGLRADFSLDMRPTERDLSHFLQYLLSENGRSAAAQAGSEPGYEFKSHMLVMGFSANDQRVRDFVAYAWDNLAPDFKVFWVCYRPDDAKNVGAFTSDYHRSRLQQNSGHAESWQGSHVLCHKHAGLLLLQLYQVLRQTLPPSGCIFPSISQLAVPPMAGRSDARAASEGGTGAPGAELIETLTRRVRSFFDPEALESTRSRIAAVWSKPDISGLTTVCGHVFRELQDEFACLWIDMNDVTGTDSMFETLLEAAYVRVGVEHWTPVYMTRDPRRRVDELARVARFANRPWVIFINARETPGANAPEPNTNVAHGWLDDEGNAEDFSELVREICNGVEEDCAQRTNRNLSAVLICRDDGSPLMKTILGGGLIEAAGSVIELKQGTTDPASRVGEALTYVEGKADQRRFLHTLVLMQRPRFASFVHWYAQTRGCSEKALEELLRELERLAVIRWKPGGFLWFHSKTRQVLRSEFLNDPATACIHRELAGWYRRVLDASTTPSAAFELVYHLCEAARMETEDSMLAEHDIREATAVLTAHAWMIQTHGYSKGSCRRLEKMRTEVDNVRRLGESTAIKFKIVCTEIMRAIAREVGEDLTAYERTVQLRNLLSNGSWDKRSSRAKLFEALKTRKGPGVLEWIRWWRWSGMLGVASRSNHLALESLETALRSFDDHDTSKPCQAVDQAIRFIRADVWTDFDKPVSAAACQKFRLEALRVLEQYIELHLIRRSVAFRLSTLPGGPRSDTGAAGTVEEALGAAKHLIGLVLANDLSAPAWDSSRARWCLSRILMHESAMADCESDRGAQTAMRLLSEAEGCYKMADPARFSSDLAMIELHRADAKLREAAQTRINGETFAAWHFAQTADRKRVKSVDVTRRIKAVLKDAMGYLDRAEPVLRERRRNVWWTGWFFERKMRAMAFAISASELESSPVPLPFLGLESAPAGNPTQPDQILRNTMRMVRVDAYRLATVLESYASCALGLSNYRAAHKTGRELENRQLDMKVTLRRGREQLQEVLRRRPGKREAAERGIEEKYFRMDEPVSEYVDAVIGRCAGAIQELGRT